jgi:hypothetical protein
MSGSGPAAAQFLRLGPFDFNGMVRTEAVYTTNVEGERPSDAKASREDYYLLVGLDLRSTAELAPETAVTLDMGGGVEKHFIRDDLDNERSPLGRIRLSTSTESGHYTIGLFGSVERKLDSGEAIVTEPGTKATQNNDQYQYGASVDWSWENWSAGGAYSANYQRYLEEEFKFGDQDTYMANLSLRAGLTRRIGIVGNYSGTKTVPVGNPAIPEDVSATWLVGTDFKVSERPNVTVTTGLEHEEEAEASFPDVPTVDKPWDPKVIVSITDSRELTETVRMGLNLNWNWESDPETDDIALTYGADLSHDISPSARQALMLNRSQALYLGSTQDATQTTFGYSFNKIDLFVYNLSLDFNISYRINEPVQGDQPKENVIQGTTQLQHKSALTRKLARVLRYAYHFEDSDQEEELLDEHRLTLGLEYTL